MPRLPARHAPSVIMTSAGMSGVLGRVAAGVAVIAAAGSMWAVVNADGNGAVRSDEPHVRADSPQESTPVQMSLLGGLVTTLDEAQARRLLEQLPLTGSSGVSGYDRDAYGEAWADVDGNGCNQRDDVLLRDAIEGSVRVAVQGSCDHDVLAGEWLDPYTGTRVGYEDLKDPVQAQAISIDHVVPLAEAHRSGAMRWDQPTRVEFANALENLLAVDGSENSAKGDQDPATWRPPPQVWCAYATVWVQVKNQSGLAVDAAERAALEEMLATC